MEHVEPLFHCWAYYELYLDAREGTAKEEEDISWILLQKFEIDPLILQINHTQNRDQLKKCISLVFSSLDRFVKQIIHYWKLYQISRKYQMTIFHSLQEILVVFTRTKLLQNINHSWMDVFVKNTVSKDTKQKMKGNYDEKYFCYPKVSNVCVQDSCVIFIPLTHKEN